MKILVDKMLHMVWYDQKEVLQCIPMGVFMFSFAMLYLYCLVTLIISTFTEISEEFKMIHCHHSSDITPTTSSKKEATTTTDADDEDTSADDTTTVNATVEEFFDAKYSHQMWMNELLLNYFEHSILLHQKLVQFYIGEDIHPSLGMVSCAYHMNVTICYLSSIHTILTLQSFSISFITLSTKGVSNEIISILSTCRCVPRLLGT